MVQAIATQTFRDGDPTAIDAFQARIVALGTAQDLLLQSSWQSASLPAVVERALAAHCSEIQRRIEGVDHVIDAKRALSLALALALALALHELATNSIKYGALSTVQGRIQIHWSVNAGELSLIWSESGGPVVAKPERTGFGTQMITRNLASGFRGDVDLNYLTSGIVLTLKAPA